MPEIEIGALNDLAEDAARVIDIDVVAYGETSDIDRRPFVIIPAAEIAGYFRIASVTLASLAADADATGVEKLDWPMPAG